MQLSWQNAGLPYTKPWFQSLAMNKLGMMVNAYKSQQLGGGGKGSNVQGNSWLHREYEAILRITKSYLKKEIKKAQESEIKSIEYTG